MSPWRRAFPPTVAVLLLLVLLGQVFVLDGLVRREARPHDAPVGFVANPVVAEALARAVGELDGQPLHAVPIGEERRARDDVRRGRLVAAVLVDLRGVEDDVVLVSSAADPVLVDGVLEQLAVVGATYNRDVGTVRVVPVGVDRDHVRAVAVASFVLGFLVALVLVLRHGPRAPSTMAGLRRLWLSAGTALLVGVVLAVLAGPDLVAGDGLGTRALVAGLLALGALTGALVTLALSALAGYLGPGLAVLVWFVLGAPLLLGVDPLLLAQPWQGPHSWSASGAVGRATMAAALGNPSGVWRPLLVLALWLAAAGAILWLTRRWRPAAAPPDARPETDDLVGGPPVDRPTQLSVWRARVLLAVLPLFVVVMVAVTLLPDPGQARPVSLPSLADESRCVPIGPVETVEDLNRISMFRRGTADFRGGDVGASGILQDGRMLWLFGDTLRDTPDGRVGMVRNSMIVVEENCLRVVRPARGGAVVPDRDNRVGYWPMSVGVEHHGGYDLVAVSVQRVRSDGPGAFDFRMLGPSVALFAVPVGGTPQFLDVRDLGPDSTDTTRPMWGAASAADDGWVLVYGTAAQAGAFGFALHVARARIDDLVRPARWQYWDGAGWQSDPTAAAPVIPAVGGTSQTLSVFPVEGEDGVRTWYAVSKRGDAVGTDLVVWSAPAPTGPFTAGPPVARLESDFDGGLFRYMPLAHPGLLPQPGTVVVSWSNNSTDVGEIIDDPRLYRIRFMRIPLPPAAG